MSGAAKSTKPSERLEALSKPKDYPAPHVVPASFQQQPQQQLQQQQQMPAAGQREKSTAGMKPSQRVEELAKPRKKLQQDYEVQIFETLL